MPTLAFPPTELRFLLEILYDVFVSRPSAERAGYAMLARGRQWERSVALEVLSANGTMTAIGG
jgi:hypothetical protein